jgi:hypothetical protein
MDNSDLKKNIQTFSTLIGYQWGAITHRLSPTRLLASLWKIWKKEKFDLFLEERFFYFVFLTHFLYDQKLDMEKTFEQWWWKRKIRGLTGMLLRATTTTTATASAASATTTTQKMQRYCSTSKEKI